jgi:hypothetical protein
MDAYLEKRLLQLEVCHPAMVAALHAAGDEPAQKALALRWMELGFGACANAGTAIDTGLVENKFKQFEQYMREIRQNIVDDFKRQFLLDNAELLKQVRQANGELAGQLSKGNIEHRESLEQRIVRAVTEGILKVTGQLTLDDPASALSHMYGGLTGLLEIQNTSNQEFQQNVTTTISTGLAAFTTRRQAEAESTLHGRTFQDRAMECLADLAGRRGHVFEDVSSKPGLIPRCKTGDARLKVGPNYRAKDAVFAVEIKEEKGYSVRDMLIEIEEARKNRGASFGVFVISAAYAPAGMPPLMHYGDDIIVAWDSNNPATNICLDAALTMACGLATREAAAKGQPIDFTAIDRTINSIETKATGLGQIFISATTIRNAADKILDECKPKHAALIEELATLRDHIAVLRGSAGGPASDSIAPESPPF